MTPVLELKDITKQFPGVLANDHISLTLEPGEIHALLGENGAGKTTLMNILYGLYQPDEGEIIVRGKAQKFHSPSDAIRAGIGMVHQHFMLIPVFTVTENVMLGDEPLKPGGFLDRKTAADHIRELSGMYKLMVDPDAYIKDLPVGVQQRVEIIKLLYRKADILIFDEPTAVLTPQEADDLFKIMHGLTAQGKSIIFITHKLREVLDIADRITVIRRGKVVGFTLPSEADQEKLASMMVGRAVDLELHKQVAKGGEVVLEVKGLSVVDERNQLAVDNISFDVRAGEILGVAGVQGNGQTELVEALTGMRKSLSGTVQLTGNNITHSHPRQITEMGIAHVPEDRQRDGLVLSFPIYENLVLQTYYLPPNARGININWDSIIQKADALIEQYDIRTPNAETTAGSLSGGNQQKVIVARELSRPIKLLIASQPTRGLDVGSIEYIHTQILHRRDDGVGVVLVSTELDEIMQLSDRIAVMYRGQIVAVVPIAEATKEYIGLLMAGISPEEARNRNGKNTQEEARLTGEAPLDNRPEDNKPIPQEDTGKVLLDEVVNPEPKGKKRRGVGRIILIPILAILSGLILGAVFIIFTTQEVYTAFGQSFGAGLSEAWRTVATAYGALFTGSIGDPARIIAALGSGNAEEIRRAFNPFLESLVTSTPYIFAGLGVALGFRAGVFNVGAEGQIFIGAAAAAFVGYSLKGLPGIIHLPLAMLAGALGGAVWGYIPGWLKAKTGGHEVINTIMMNYIAFRLSDWLLTGPMKRPGSFNPISPTIENSAMLPTFFGAPIRFHLGFFVALAVAYLVYWFLFKTTWGFNLRTVGANPSAAKYAGMNVARNTIAAMALSGALCGLAGANEVLGVNHNLAMAFSSGYGFDSIALALLGNSHPAGVVLASLLFGTLRNGATRMQVLSNIPIDIISILQAVILAFIAAPAIIRTIYRLRGPSKSEGAVTLSSWGGNK